MGMTTDLTLLVLRVLGGGILLAGGVSKLAADRQAVTGLVTAYGLPASVGAPVAAVLPPLETVLGTLILLGLWARPAAACGAALLVVLSAAVARALRLGLAPSCGCFGPGGGPISWKIVARNLGLAGGLSLVAAFGTRATADAALSPTARVALALAIGAAVAIAVAASAAGRPAINEEVSG